MFKNTLCVNRIHVSHICIQWFRNLPRTSSHLGKNPLENFLTRGFVTFFMLHVFRYRLVNISWSHLNSKSKMVLEFLKTLLICKAFYASNAGHTKGIFMKKIKSTIINWLTILHLGLNINFVYYSKFVIQFYINKE